MEHVKKVVVKTANFICARQLNHRQFDNLLNEEGVRHGLAYHTEVRLLSRGIVLKVSFELRRQIVNFMKIISKSVIHLQSRECVLYVESAVDITDHLNNLNRMLQCRFHTVL